MLQNPSHCVMTDEEASSVRRSTWTNVSRMYLSLCTAPSYVFPGRKNFNATSVPSLTFKSIVYCILPRQRDFPRVGILHPEAREIKIKKIKIKKIRIKKIRIKKIKIKKIKNIEIKIKTIKIKIINKKSK